MPYYNRDPKKDHNFDNHPGIKEPGVVGASMILDGSQSNFTTRSATQLMVEGSELTATL